MTPAEEAAAVYEKEPCARTFREDVEAHMLCGYVVATPEVFAMFRPVRWSAGQEAIVNPWHAHVGCDTWHIYLAAGDVEQIRAMLPYPLPYVAFERKNQLRRCPLKRFSTLVKSIRKKD